MHITLAYLGEIQDAEIEFNRVAELLANYAGDRVVVPAEISGYGRFAGAEGDMDAVFALVDSEALHQFRFWLADYLEWDLGADVSRRWGFIPHVTLGYVPSGAAVELPPMALSWGELTVEFSLQGAVRDAESVIANRCSCSGGNMNEQEKKAKATKAADPALAANEEGAQEAAQQAVVEGAAELALPERGECLPSTARSAPSAGSPPRPWGMPFSKAELEAMGLDSLVKLEASIAPVGQTYVGRNGANVAANVDGGLRAYKGAKPADQAQAEVKQ